MPSTTSLTPASPSTGELPNGTADEIATAWRYADKLGLIGPLMEQPHYNMLVREKVAKEYEHLYEEIGLGLTVFSPLKIGILTGKYNEGIPKDSRLGASNDPFVQSMNKRFGDEGWRKELEIVAKLKPIADKRRSRWLR